MDNVPSTQTWPIRFLNASVLEMINVWSNGCSNTEAFKKLISLPFLWFSFLSDNYLLSPLLTHVSGLLAAMFILGASYVGQSDPQRVRDQWVFVAIVNGWSAQHRACAWAWEGRINHCTKWGDGAKARAQALLLPGSSSSLFLEQNPVSMKKLSAPLRSSLYFVTKEASVGWGEGLSGKGLNLLSRR